MNPLLKKFLAFSLALLVLVSPLLITAQEKATPEKIYMEYGLEPERVPSKTKPKTTVPRQMNVRQLRRSLELFPRAGGIMFDAVAKPCTGLTNTRLRLSYNRTQPDGQRLILHAGERTYSIDGIRDSDLRPIAMFADDRVPVLANLQSPDASITASCQRPSSSLRIVTLHQAFIDTQLGWLLTRMDSIPWNFSMGTRWDKKDEPLPDATLPLANSLSTALRKDEAAYAEMRPKIRSGLFNQGFSTVKGMTTKQKRQYEGRIAELSGYDLEIFEDQFGSVPGFDAQWWQLDTNQKYILVSLIASVQYKRVSNFNDVEAPPSFCTEASSIKLDGLPKLEFVAPKVPENYPLPLSSSLMTENLDQLRLVDQDAYDAMVTTYRLAGLFRYVKKQQAPIAWKRFLKSLPPPQTKSTYVVLCPQCEKDAVEQWWQCAESKLFPARRDTRPRVS